jgi:hypothetical protein
MPDDLALIIALAVPFLLFVALRVNASMVFLSLCLGEVLVLYVASQANELIRMFAPHVSPVSTSTLQLSFLLVPAIITMIVTAFSVHGGLKMLINVFPALAASALAVLLAIPLLPGGLRYNLEHREVWRYLSKSQALVIGIGAVLSLLFLWGQRRHLKQPEKKHHH